MKFCRIYRITGHYAVMFVISSSYWAIKNWMIDNGRIGYPWRDEPGDLIGCSRSDMTAEQYDSIDYRITEVMPIMAEVGDEPIEIGGYIE